MLELGPDAKGLRFGDGKGVAGDFMIADFFSLSGASSACAKLHGSRAFGRRLTCEFTQATKSGLKRDKIGGMTEAPRKKGTTEPKVGSSSVSSSCVSVDTDLSSYKTVDGVVVYDFEKIGWGSS